MLRAFLFLASVIIVCLAGPIQEVVVGTPGAKYDVDEDSIGEKYGWVIWLIVNFVGIALAAYSGTLGE